MGWASVGLGLHGSCGSPAGALGLSLLRFLGLLGSVPSASASCGSWVDAPASTALEWVSDVCKGVNGMGHSLLWFLGECPGLHGSCGSGQCPGHQPLAALGSMVLGSVPSASASCGSWVDAPASKALEWVCV
jgi:hypothetical protein